ncbi:hypothetical protein [Methylobacterium sp. Leaf118]|uniref:hypothetical protein n=1 Tax=Methylobacterium sp. Leaf118 TaxID=2876562 RepID=UPI001E44BFCA|nr:hypothetical protein [Methylobacterium sp. Leaf118]
MSVDAPTDPQTTRRDKRIVWALFNLILATVLAGVLLPSAPKHAALAPAEDPACAEWGDGCQICQRREDGVACSLPGIACSPGPVACQRRAGAP